ncbi:MAG: heparinase II/III family protein [Bacilli bacterium]
MKSLKKMVAIISVLMILTLSMLPTSFANTDEVLRERPLDYWVFKTSASGKDVVDISKTIMSGNIYVRPDWPAIAYADPIDWSMNPYNNNSWQLYFHSLNMVSYLTAAYEKTGDIQYLERAKFFVESWAAANIPESSAPSMYSWYRAAVSNRVVSLIHFWSQYSKVNPNDTEFAEKFKGIMRVHAENIADDKNYMFQHNHGIFQSRALIEIALVFPEFPESEEWLQKSVTRILGHLERDVTASGAHKEHSPGYHIIFRNLILDIERFIEQFGKSMPEITAMLAKMDQHFAQMSDQTWRGPSFGDSFRDNIAALRYPHHPYMEYIISKGKSGTQPPLNYIDPTSGYAVFRNTWTSTDALYTAFTAASFSTVHKHADDLSFVLRYGKTDWFIDGGKYLYGDDPFRSYLVSQYAHNTMVVNNSTYSVKKSPGKVKIRNAGETKDFVYVVGEHTIYTGITIRRTYLYHKKYESILILDEARSNSGKDNTYTQLLNIGKDVDVIESGKGVFQLNSKIEEREIELIQSRPYSSFKNQKGETYPMRGWQSTGFARLEANNLLQFTQKGKWVDFNTIINMKPESGIAKYSVKKRDSYYTFNITDKKGVTSSINVKVTTPSK